MRQLLAASLLLTLPLLGQATINAKKSINKNSVSYSFVKSCKDRAENGDCDAQFDLGFLYEMGLIGKPDYKSAIKWYKKAAAAGHTGSQYQLGIMYLNGTGTILDPNKAVELFRSAAEQDDSSAQCELGKCYKNGIGIPQNYTESTKWLQKSANNGQLEAQLLLAKAYFIGQGVDCDYFYSYIWASIAASNRRVSIFKNIEADARIIIELSQKMLSNDQLKCAQDYACCLSNKISETQANTSNKTSTTHSSK